jgi:hypothetical protein
MLQIKCLKQTAIFKESMEGLQQAISRYDQAQCDGLQ